MPPPSTPCRKLMTLTSCIFKNVFRRSPDDSHDNLNGSLQINGGCDGEFRLRRGRDIVLRCPGIERSADGTFPKGISDFSLDPISGLFELHMLYLSPCDTKFEIPVRCQCNITDMINYGRLSDLSGVAAQELFLWLPVKSIHVDIPSSGLIYFDVDVVFKQFSLSFFETPKDCKALQEDCGIDYEVVYFDNGGQTWAVEILGLKLLSF